MRLLDLLCIVLAVSGAYTIRFGSNDEASLRGQTTDYSYVTVSLLLIVAWWVALEYTGSRDTKFIGTGIEEYRRVTATSLWLFGAVAVFSYVFQLQTARGYVAVALPLGVIFLVISRWFQRKALQKTRREGLNLHRVLLIGASSSVEHLNSKLEQHIVSGYKPVAAVLTDTGSVRGELSVINAAPSVDLVLDAIDRSGADTVAISSGGELDPTFLRHLGWALSAREVGMIMAPALTDISGPRIHMQPVAGLPLIHVTTPKLEGMKAIAKRVFDLLTASLLLLILAIPMAIVALLVRLDSPGPALFFQERVGKRGELFKMIKFRSMRTDAEALLVNLQEQSEGNGVLFKMKKDPRVTRVGSWIRRFSLDELPQLFNVLNGTMSLVGPRPPLSREVALYDNFAHRRLLVKPGITGLWQVSGRSDLSWEESIRLDLYYVENWSLAQDLLILAKTARAVVGKDGAY
ncbi:sugar transferase [Arthrobacter sp. RCC_34]|uniref:sugar transferase n=1 Tax=Arthrobacter sp. RCC_34 TaxID=3239230 RepID=UPI00352596EC